MWRGENLKQRLLSLVSGGWLLAGVDGWSSVGVLEVGHVFPAPSRVRLTHSPPEIFLDWTYSAPPVAV